MSAVSFFGYLLDSPIVSCMEQDCKYVVNNDGNIQLHPKTGEPLQDCKTTKSDYVVAMEIIERVVDKVTPETKVISNTSSITDCSKMCE